MLAGVGFKFRCEAAPAVGQTSHGPVTTAGVA